MTVAINEKLNLVVPLYRDTGLYAYVHSVPVSREVFEANFLLISKTFTAIYTEGLSEITGPRIAGLVMNSIAQAMQASTKSDINPAQSLLNEIRRLTTVLVSDAGGWQNLTLHDALAMRKLDEDDVVEVENAIVFFICVSSIHRRAVLREILPGAVELWGARISSLNATAFAASLPTSTETGTSSATPRAYPTAMVPPPAATAPLAPPPGSPLSSLVS